MTDESQHGNLEQLPRSLIQNQVQKPISHVSPGLAGGGPAGGQRLVPDPAESVQTQSVSLHYSDKSQLSATPIIHLLTCLVCFRAADVLFDSFASDGRINVNQFFEAIWSSGLHRSDPRLRECFFHLRKLQDAEGSVDRDTFHRCVTGFVSLIMKALQGRFVIPDFSTFTEETQKLFSRCRQLSSVQLAGRLSAEEEEKYDSVLNVIRRLSNKEHANLNCSRYQRSRNFKDAAVSFLSLASSSCYQSSRKAGARLHALSFYLQETKCFPERADITAALDLMLQCASTEITCESGAAMAASLANGGVCPLSGDQVLSPAATRSMLSMMQVAGMKDYSTTFHYKASTPAVSSSHGSLLAVVPGVLGLMAFSPELDACGNPWRAVHFCQELISTFQLHSFDIRTPFRQILAYRQWKAESEGYQIMNVLLAALKGDVQALRRYFLSGVDVNAVDYDGRSALHVAAAEGHTEVIRFLLENAGANRALKDSTRPLIGCDQRRRHSENPSDTWASSKLTREEETLQLCTLRCEQMFLCGTADLSDEGLLDCQSTGSTIRDGQQGCMMGSFRRPRPRFMSSPVLSDLARFHASSPALQLSNTSVWNSVQSAVIKVFQGGALQSNELYTLNESIRWLLKTEMGSFITDYFQLSRASLCFQQSEETPADVDAVAALPVSVVTVGGDADVRLKEGRDNDVRAVIEEKENYKNTLLNICHISADASAASQPVKTGHVTRCGSHSLLPTVKMFIRPSWTVRSSAAGNFLPVSAHSDAAL
ncbi:Glutaminase liver isoform, mitochondrial [Collichthys lucidus]|uniref:glutaminase n=1 Tax=Collichthys lucidus TaxID=240159 RepID=A0A4U5UEB2_COLLU|nr:Glutaminase liver isoform, mitochondrial [Collichthys lucidus]